MLDGGADPRYLARRIVRMAWEDIGLADPRAARIALDAAETYERLGTPEGELALAQALIYLAVAPKSNAGYKAYNEARRFVSKDQSRGVPVHLRNAPTKLMKELGYGHEYRYAHDEPDAYAAGETYLPDGMREPHWYEPTPRGLEGKIGDKMARLAELDAQWRRENKPRRRAERFHRLVSGGDATALKQRAFRDPVDNPELPGICACARALKSPIHTTKPALPCSTSNCCAKTSTASRSASPTAATPSTSRPSPRSKPNAATSRRAPKSCRRAATACRSRSAR